ncbi:60S acidic ribosomal protein P0 [Wickerhamomyces ciferrii]|uniref:60S acidic ribosomal protein P0 n=1 Tax=Wickerhamomyces ciferrii (strain ATCC 14091 / BCRC 22168 / CBS 111 / JCM 3599 / NBRC 0793 / NRRL Y-1031 F-60-10) TaxID=1206466 RepID=K0KRG8_WICCF|nr:60S acidic ribosomal protein P0 [Wickerhamomyces ciferrii]CCH43913.1 60S acidic ribosomal protein P0 [Wickerhamomyces ciferrii]
MGGVREKKVEYFAKLRELLEEYKSIFIVGVDNVSSQQMHEVRKALRGKAVILMGKNTMVRRAIRGFLSELPDYEKLLPYVKGNVGFVFTNSDLKDIRDVIIDNKVAAPARAGAFAPADVWVPAINTGLEPGKTSFFQALGVPTKIARGTIEIVSDVKVVEAGAKVGPSEASLLNLLNISPFTYGLAVIQVYDNGQVFPSSVLDITDDELVGHFVSAVNTIASISLAIGYPTLPSVGHSVVNSYKDLLAVAIATKYVYPEIEELADRIENPDKYASAAPAAASAPAASEDAPAAAAEEEEEASDDDMGFGLFD